MPETTPKTAENIAAFLNALETPSKTLTAWELGFVASVADRFEREGRISDRQFEILEGLYAEKTA